MIFDFLSSIFFALILGKDYSYDRGEYKNKLDTPKNQITKWK